MTAPNKDLPTQLSATISICDPSGWCIPWLITPRYVYVMHALDASSDTQTAR